MSLRDRSKFCPARVTSVPTQRAVVSNFRQLVLKIKGWRPITPRVRRWEESAPDGNVRQRPPGFPDVAYLLGLIVLAESEGWAMMLAVFKSRVIAAGDDAVVAAGDHYLPWGPLALGRLRTTRDDVAVAVEGVANNVGVEIDGAKCADGKWAYRPPFPCARRITRLALCRHWAASAHGQ